MPQTKRQYKTPEKQLNEVRIGNFPEKRFQNDSENDPETQRMKEMNEMFTKDLEELKNKQR